jgi:hypothetical protein
MPAGNEGILDKVKEVAERSSDKVRGLFSQDSDQADAAIAQLAPTGAAGS